jgi:LTXXQ motif family protein
MPMMPRAAIRAVLIVAVVTVILEARVESTRWWWSPEVVTALRLSRAQSLQLDRAYESSLPMRRRLGEQIVALADRVQLLNDDDAPDEELMPATERLTRAQADRCALRTSLLSAVDVVLTPEQRATFRRLVARKLINSD